MCISCCCTCARRPLPFRLCWQTESRCFKVLVQFLHKPTGPGDLVPAHVRHLIIIYTIITVSWPRSRHRPPLTPSYLSFSEIVIPCQSHLMLRFIAENISSFAFWRTHLESPRRNFDKGHGYTPRQYEL